MGKVVFQFPGQGSQAIGMGVSLAEIYPLASSLFEQASTFLGWDLLKVCKEGPEDKLRETNVAQSALFVTAYATAMVLQNLGIHPEAAAGHSIGEYTALTVAGVLSYPDALRLVKERGSLMHEAARAKPGEMAAILGVEALQLEQWCTEVKTSGLCIPVNYNSPEQIVVAGEASAVRALCRLAEEKGAKRVIPLNVSGAFHSPLMATAATTMRDFLAKTTFNDARCPIAMNVDGRLRKSGDDIRKALSLQLDHPVRWVDTVKSLAAESFSTFIECGPGRVLSGLLRRIDRQLQSYSTETPEAIQEATGALLHRGVL